MIMYPSKLFDSTIELYRSLQGTDDRNHYNMVHVFSAIVHQSLKALSMKQYEQLEYFPKNHTLIFKSTVKVCNDTFETKAIFPILQFYKFIMGNYVNFWNASDHFCVSIPVILTWRRNSISLK